MEFVILTGLSGAGKTRAMHAMEVDLAAKGGALRATVRVERRCESPVAVFLLGLCVGEIQSAGEYHFGYEPF